MRQQSNTIAIFCCYAHEDQSHLDELQKQLKSLQRQNMVDVRYDGDIPPGTEWDQEVKKYLNDAGIILLLISPDFISSNYCYSIVTSYALKLYKQGKTRVIPIIVRPVTSWQDVSPIEDIKLGDLQVLPRDARAVTVWENRDQAWERVADEIKAVVCKLRPSTSYPTVSPCSPPWEGSPFPGLRAFTQDDAPIFFGRDKETDELVEKVTDNRFVAVVGASGSGKSSLVGAGLLPRLAANAIKGSKDWVIVQFTPGEVGSNPFMALAVQLAPMLLKHGWNARKLAKELNTDSNNLDKLSLLVLSGKSDWVEILLFIDQFEELFTLVEEEERETFVEMLAKVTQSKRIRIVVTLRADFYHRCVEWAQLAELLRTGSYPLAAPELGALQEMITLPAACAGLQFEKNLPEDILFDTGKNPGALPLLAYALDQLYHSRNEQGKLTHVAYDSFGRVQGAISTRAEAIFNTLDSAAQAALSDIFYHLVAVNEEDVHVTKQRVRYTQIVTTDAAERLVEALTNARLLVRSSDGERQEIVEVAHEALFLNWPKLVRWIEQEWDNLWLLRQVKLAAREWDRNGRDSIYLWPDERLKPAYKMPERLLQKLDETQLEFIRPEIKRLEQELEDVYTVASHARREAISQKLLLIGDTRPGVGLRTDSLPDIRWCEVPRGRIKLGGNAGTFDVAPFYIAKYPVTYIQFQAFLNDRVGYNSDQWWRGIGKDGVEVHNQRLKFANYPCENVRWYAAVAFCEWLTARFAAIPSSLPPSLSASGKRFIIRLPTEWEWQQAATGGKSDYVYPWGKQKDTLRANTQESGLDRTVAVGMYPQGASPVGTLDMIGNVQEWCLNEPEKPENTGMNSTALRVLRGCSFEMKIARIDFRTWSKPNYRFDSFVGFRVAYASVV